MPSNIFPHNTTTITTRSPRGTFLAAARFAKTLRPGDVVALVGPLGAGKTCFARGIIAALAHNPEQFQGSPSFAIVQEYPAPLATICHFDFYRLAHPHELLNIGWGEYLSNNRICLVEWADRFPELLPPHSYWLHFMITGPKSRSISLSTH